MSMSRNRKITPEIIPDIVEDYASGEMRIIDICKKYDIGESTWYDNLNPQSDQYNPEFSEAIKKADKNRMDNLADLAETGMKKLLQGYEYEEITTVIDPNAGKDENKIKEVKRTKKQVKPDKTIIMFVATNRRPKKWKHRSQIGIENVGDKPLKVLNVSKEDLENMDASSLVDLLEDEG